MFRQVKRRQRPAPRLLREPQALIQMTNPDLMIVNAFVNCSYRCMMGQGGLPDEKRKANPSSSV